MYITPVKRAALFTVQRDETEATLKKKETSYPSE
jgi:hypothetical protein